MEWLAVIGLIVLGVGLLVVEIIFVPGTTIVGIIGFLCSGWGIYLGYEYFGKTGGSFVLVGSIIFNAFVIIYAFKSTEF